MEFLRKIRDFIQDLEEKDFYKYLGIALAVLVLVLSFMVYRYYSNVSSYTREIEEINDLRSGQVRDILTRFEIVKKQREEANEMLKKELDFKIKGYFDKLLKKLNLKEYQKEEGRVIQKDISDEYSESEFSVRLDGMDMKQLCELLKELEATPRIKINLLEIRRAKKKSDAIDVDLTLSTLLLKSGETT
ncbi:hypothetical protein ACFLYU_02150 [Candidatus Dependentiae bacterium]